ncbi:unnamed protein product [Natator depressus]
MTAVEEFKYYPQRIGQPQTPVALRFALAFFVTEPARVAEKLITPLSFSVTVNDASTIFPEFDLDAMWELLLPLIELTSILHGWLKPKERTHPWMQIRQLELLGDTGTSCHTVEVDGLNPQLA